MIAQKEKKWFPLFSFKIQLHWIDFSPINQSNAHESICAANGIVLAALECQCVHTSAYTEGDLVSVRDDIEADHTRHFKGSARADDHQTALQFL